MKTKFSGILTLLLAFVVQLTFAQEKTISGTVSDISGLPVPGVNILVKGTTTGTQTDFDGNYSLKAKSGDVLSFSYLGLKTKEVTVGASSTVNVTMEEDTAVLDEVVVTALGIKREEKALGYSVQNVAGEGLSEARESNLVNALSGKAAGVQVTNSSGSVGSSSRIVLRGNSSITGNNEPLFVVDGVPIDNTSYGNAGDGGGRDLPNGAASINPDDIESVSVLKGPNAAALYGLRAGNGVIVITTKSGKGKGGKKFSVAINNNVTFSNPLILADYQNSYGQGADPNYFEFVDGSGGGINDGVDESWGPPLDVGLEFIQWNSQLNGGVPLPWVSHPDNVRDFLRTGITTSNNISLSSASDTGSMRLSLGNNLQTGMVPFTEFNTHTVGFSGNMDLGTKLHAGVSLNYINDNSDQVPSSGYSAENPFLQFIWSARNVNFPDLADWRNLPLADPNTAAAGTPLNWNTNFENNPYWALETNRNTYKRDRIIGNVNLSYDFNDWLSLTTKLGLDHYSQLETTRRAIGTNESANGFYQEVTRRFSGLTTDVLLSVNKDINDDFSFSLSVGASGYKQKYNLLFGTANQLELPDFYSLSNIKSGVTPVFGNTYQESRINSALAFGQIAFRNYLFVDFTARNDWASVLPAANNSFFYPSVSASAVVSDMFPDIKGKIDFLKIRGSWSKVGSIGALGPYNLNQTFGLVNNAYGNQAFTPATLYNPNLKAETVTGIEAGLDLKMFNNRLRLSATYYNQKSEDLLVPIQVSASTGNTSVWDNIADMENKGYEIQLGVTVLEAKDFSFDVDINFAQNENTVTSLGELDTYILGGQWGMRLEAQPGQPYGVIVGRGFERSPDGQVIYENGLPVIDNTYKNLGNIAPDWTGGLSFDVRYKGFSLNTLVDAKIGGDIHSMSYSWGRYAGTLSESLYGRETGIVGNGVMSDGNGGYVPNNVVVPGKLFNQNSYSNDVEESAIFDASYVKLRAISLGYSFPQKWLENTFISDVKLSVVGRNLAILYKVVPHIDPESAFSSANGNQGQEFGQLPSARSIGFNLNLKF